MQVGVHIADVSHFIRPGTAIDKEAEERGTTVYLTDRRIDMVPELLSSNLCSLRCNVERYSILILKIKKNKNKGLVNIHWGLGPVQKAIGRILFFAKIIIELSGEFSSWSWTHQHIKVHIYSLDYQAK